MLLCQSHGRPALGALENQRAVSLGSTDCSKKLATQSQWIHGQSNGLDRRHRPKGDATVRTYTIDYEHGLVQNWKLTRFFILPDDSNAPPKKKKTKKSKRNRINSEYGDDDATNNAGAGIKKHKSQHHHHSSTNSMERYVYIFNVRYCSSTCVRRGKRPLLYVKDFSSCSLLCFDFLFLSTATAEGQMMWQMLSTFSHLEQSRFEAYQRATFSQDAVKAWVAATLSNRYGLAELRPLEDLVSPGQASDIGMIVSALAKIYAQRLVSAAKTIQGNESAEPAPLLPEHIRKAWEQRTRQGLDPGFFLQSSSGIGGPVVADNHNLRRLAALAAQEEHDKQEATAEERQEDVTMKDAIQVESPLPANTANDATTPAKTTT